MKVLQILSMINQVLKKILAVFEYSCICSQSVVNEYFDNLAKVMDDNKFTAEQIFNVDETGETTVRNPKHVITAKGTRNVGSITSGERGKLVTAVYTIGASGSVLPPMPIFPRVHFRDHLIKRGPQSCYRTMQ